MPCLHHWSDRLPSCRLCGVRSMWFWLLISYLGIDLQNKGNLVYRCWLHADLNGDLPYDRTNLAGMDISKSIRLSQRRKFWYFSSVIYAYVEDRVVIEKYGGEILGPPPPPGKKMGFGGGGGGGQDFFGGWPQLLAVPELFMAKKRNWSPEKCGTKITSLFTKHAKDLIFKAICKSNRWNAEKCFEAYPLIFANGRNLSLRIPTGKILMLSIVLLQSIWPEALMAWASIVAGKRFAPDELVISPVTSEYDEGIADRCKQKGGGKFARFSCCC